MLLSTSDLDAQDPAPRTFGFSYGEDTSVGPDGRTRVLGYVREHGAGAVAYFALGHCHSPSTNIQPFVDASVDAAGATPLHFRGPWETDAFERLLRNGIEWGLEARRRSDAPMARYLSTFRIGGCRQIRGKLLLTLLSVIATMAACETGYRSYLRHRIL